MCAGMCMQTPPPPPPTPHTTIHIALCEGEKGCSSSSNSGYSNRNVPYLWISLLIYFKMVTSQGGGGGEGRYDILMICV